VLHNRTAYLIPVNNIYASRVELHPSPHPPYAPRRMGTNSKHQDERALVELIQKSRQQEVQQLRRRKAAAEAKVEEEFFNYYKNEGGGGGGGGGGGVLKSLQKRPKEARTYPVGGRRRGPVVARRRLRNHGFGIASDRAQLSLEQSAKRD